MRVFRRVILLFAMAIILIVVGAYLARGALVGSALRFAMASAGFENPSVTVEAVALDRLLLKDVKARKNKNASLLSIDAVEVRFSWRDIIADRRVESVAIGPGRIEARLTETGAIDIAGLRLPNGSENDAGPAFNFDALPLTAVAVNAITFRLVGDEGAIDTVLDGAFDKTNGADVTVSVESSEFVYGPITVSALSGRGSIQLIGDGGSKTNVAIATDLSIESEDQKQIVRDVDISFEADGGSWIDVISGDLGSLSAQARLRLNSGKADLDSNIFAPALTVSGVTDEARAPLETISVSGALDFDLADGVLSITSPKDGAFIIVSNRGDRLSITSTDTTQPLLTLSQRAAIGQVSFALEGPSFEARATTSFSRTDEEPWRFALGATSERTLFAAQDLGAELSKLSLIASGRYRESVIDSNLWISTDADIIRVGRMIISDTPFSAQLSTEIDLAEQNVIVRQPDRAGAFPFIRPGCLAIDRSALDIKSQDLSATVREAKLCARNEAPLLRASWGRERQAKLIGLLTAERANYRLGETTLAGRPPGLALTVNYDPERHQSTFSGEFSGGSVAINGAMRATGARGAVTGALTDDELSADFTIDTVSISQIAEVAQLETLVATGNGRLADDVMVGQYLVETRTGRNLGGGEARHEVKTGKGRATYRSGRLELAPDGLQPADIVLSLIGIVSEATGAVQIEADVSWTNNDLQSTADIQLDEITFRGPGVAVSQTRSVSGKMALQNLLPVKSKGPQIMAIGAMEIGALILENGNVKFELPGDETLQVVKAEFPWYGGRIGAYDSSAALTGEKARTVLKADDVSLAAMLASLDIDGLSGEGRVEGVLPLVIENGRARIENGRMTALGPGVIRYTGDATEAAAGANDEAQVAFGILRNLNFETLTAEINGPLDGALNFKLLFEGTNEIPLTDPRVEDKVVAPVIYRISLEAPLLSIINNARNSADPRFLIDQARSIRIEGEKIEEN